MIKLQKPLTFQPKQMLALQAILDQQPDSPCVIGIGGSRGGAKSGLVRRAAVSIATSEALKGSIIWIIRRVWDDLNKDHVKPLFVEWPELLPFWHAGDKELHLPNGSSIFFIHAGDSGRAKRKARGPAAHYIFLEQAEEFSQAEIEQLDGSNRAAGAAPGVCKKILTFNPGGIGTNYLRRVFWKKEFLNNERPGNFLFIHAYGWDNYEWFRGVNGAPTEEEFYSDPAWNAVETFEDRSGVLITECRRRFEFFVQKTDFGRKLDALPQSARIGELLGSFEHFSGQYYADVWDESSIILSPEIVARIVKPWWRRWLATDWGFSHYAATGWFATGLLAPADLLGLFGCDYGQAVPVIVLYREEVTNEVPEPDLARLILARTPDAERREIRSHYIGHDAWQGERKGTDHSVVEQMDPILARGGLQKLSRADIDRVGGWRLIFNCLGAARKLRAGQWTPEDPPPLFISAACPEVQSAIPTLVCDYDPTTRPDGNPQDVRKMSGHIADDVADMVRYGLKSYLDASDRIPDEVTRVETFNRYQDPTDRAMAMRLLEAQQSKGMYLRRKARA